VTQIRLGLEITP